MATSDRYEPDRVPTALAAATKPRDLVLLALVPAVLVGIFALPVGVRAAYLLDYRDPTVATAFASSFVHLTAGHLTANLLGYLVVVPAAYALSVSGRRRREFWVAFITFLVPLPLALSALDVAFARPVLGYGFSGVVMAFVGFLPLPLVWHVEARFDGTADGDHSPILFFLGIGTIAAWAAPPSVPSLVVLVVAVGAGLAHLRSLLSETHRSVVNAVRDAASVAGHFEVALGGLVLFALFPVAAFPADPTGANTVVDLYTHLLGFCFGYIVPYTTFLLLGGGLD